MAFIARQPIFDANKTVQAYELLYRETEENRYNGTDPNLASKRTIDTAVLVGLDVLSDGRSIFLNCTTDLLVEGYPGLFPPNLTVIEVRETVEPEENVLSAIRKFREAGYRIALDDFVDQAGIERLTELTDIIKVDVQATPPENLPGLVRRYARHNRKLLAEKVETYDEFISTSILGFSLFQGYFFCKPKVLSTRTASSGATAEFRIMAALHAPELNFIELEQLIKSEPALCYRLLRYLNSPVFYLQEEVQSVLHALMLLGEVEVRKWLLLVCVAMSQDVSNREVVMSALIRARFLELLARYTKLPPASLFIMGLFSLMDAVLGMTMGSLLKEVVVPSEVREALLGVPSRLRQTYDLILAYEAAEWAKCDEMRRQFQIPADELRDAYLEAVAWAKRLSPA